MEKYPTPEPSPEQPEEPAQPLDNQPKQPSFTDHESATDIQGSIAAWQQHENEPKIPLGQGVIWRPGQSKSRYWRDAINFIASIAAQQAHENPDDQEAQDTYNFWLERVKQQQEQKPQGE